VINSKETLVTSSGIIRNRSIPRVGVVSASSLHDDLFEDCLNHGIDLSWESFIEETTQRLKDENPHLDDTEIESLLENETECVQFDSRRFLLGAWIKDASGQYVIDKTGKSGNFALTYNTETNTVCVEWSTLTTQCNNTSPCYVMAECFFSEVFFSRTKHLVIHSHFGRHHNPRHCVYYGLS